MLVITRWVAVNILVGILFLVGAVGFFQAFPREGLALFAGIVVSVGVLNVEAEQSEWQNQTPRLTASSIAIALFWGFMTTGFMLMAWDAFVKGP